jgi:hypothetical protein
MFSLARKNRAWHDAGEVFSWGLLAVFVIDQTVLLRAFWHKGRRCFVMWTSEELVRRVGVDDPENRLVGKALSAMRGYGVAELVQDTLHSRSIPPAWKLTAKGESLAAKLIGGQ